MSSAVRCVYKHIQKCSRDCSGGIAHDESTLSNGTKGNRITNGIQKKIIRSCFLLTLHTLCVYPDTHEQQGKTVLLHCHPSDHVVDDSDDQKTSPTCYNFVPVTFTQVFFYYYSYNSSFSSTCFLNCFSAASLTLHFVFFCSQPHKHPMKNN